MAVRQDEPNAGTTQQTCGAPSMRAAADDLLDLLCSGIGAIDRGALLRGWEKLPKDRPTNLVGWANLNGPTTRGT
jgi:hypothetical protein